MQLPDWAYVATVGAAIVALLALVVTIAVHLMNIRKERRREWQRVGVFDILSNGPLPLNEIDAAYGRLVQQKGDMPLREMKTEALKRELLRLVADGVVQRHRDETYALREETPADSRDALLEVLVQGSLARDRMMAAEHWIVELLRGKPGQLTESEILLQMSRDQSIDLEEYEKTYLLRHMAARRVIERDDEGRFTLGVPGKRIVTTSRTVTRRSLPFKDRSKDVESS